MGAGRGQSLQRPPLASPCVGVIVLAAGVGGARDDPIHAGIAVVHAVRAAKVVVRHSADTARGGRRVVDTARIWIHPAAAAVDEYGEREVMRVEPVCPSANCSRKAM